MVFAKCLVSNSCIVFAWGVLLLPQAIWAQSATYALKTESWIEVVPSTFMGTQILSGSHVAHTYGLAEQKTNSLKSKLTGTLTTNINGSQLVFTGQNLLDVPVHPQDPFLPDAPGEDNFGGFLRRGPDVVGEAAIRDISAALVGGSIQVGVRPELLQFSLASGFLDYRLDFFEGYFELSTFEIVSNASLDPVTGSFTGTIHIPFFLEYEYAAISTEPDSVLVLRGEIVAERLAAGLEGDYNSDNIVDAADYAVWRDRSGTTNALPNDPIGGTIGSAQYQQWRRLFGKTAGAGIGAMAGPCPNRLRFA